MAKILGIKDNFRVVVEPRRLGDFGSVSVSDSFFGQNKERIAADYLDRCEEIAAEIKRHVDNVRYVSVEFDQGHVCEHCGDRWTEESDSYNGGCCSKDEEAQMERENVS